MTAFEVQITGKHRVDIEGEQRDFAPRWSYLAVDDNSIHGSYGSALRVLFDGQLGKWAGSGYFTNRFNDDELIQARPGTISQDTSLAAWPGVQTGPVVVIGRASSQSLCETIAGVRVCPNEDAFNITEREMYRGGIGPVAYIFESSFSFSGGNFFSSITTTEEVGLVASSLRGDVASPMRVLEIEPNQSLLSAHRLAMPATISGNVVRSDSWGELKFYDADAEKWLFIELHDLYKVTVPEAGQVTITLTAEEGADADLNLLLLVLTDTENEDTVIIGGQTAEVIDLSTTGDPVETITAMLDAGEYFVGVQAFRANSRTDYTLTVE